MGTQIAPTSAEGTAESNGRRSTQSDVANQTYTKPRGQAMARFDSLRPGELGEQQSVCAGERAPSRQQLIEQVVRCRCYRGSPLVMTKDH